MRSKDRPAADPRFPWGTKYTIMTMLDFIQGWRRKMGCFTLFVACALMAASIRAHFIIDKMCIASSYNQRVWLESRCHGLSLIRYEWVIIGVCLPDPIGWSQRTAEPGDGGFVSDLPIPPLEVQRRWHFLGFEFEEYCNPLGYATATCLTVPFIPNVIVLAFISALLLLRKPHGSPRLRKSD